MFPKLSGMTVFTGQKNSQVSLFVHRYHSRSTVTSFRLRFVWYATLRLENLYLVLEKKSKQFWIIAGSVPTTVYLIEYINCKHPTYRFTYTRYAKEISQTHEGKAYNSRLFIPHSMSLGQSLIHLIGKKIVSSAGKS